MRNNPNHPNTMKEKELEKEKEKIMKLLGFPHSSTMLIQLHFQSPFELITTVGSTLIPRVINNNVMVYAFRADIQMESNGHRTNSSQHGARVNDVINKIDMDLLKAASCGDIARAQDAVCRNKELLRLKDSRGNLPLHLAVEKGHKEVAIFLVREYPQGAYALNNLMVSPLYLAVQHRKDLDLVKGMFCELGAVLPDTNVLLEGLKKGKSILRAAITDNNQDMLKLVLKYQRDLIKATDEEGLTPLSYAAYNGFVDIVTYLLTKIPRSIDYRNNDKSKPIHKACLGGHLKVIEKFHSQDPVSLSSTDGNGQTVLHLAAKESQDKLEHVVSYLLSLPEGRVLINKKDEMGFTPLKLAQQSGNHKVKQNFPSMPHA